MSQFFVASKIELLRTSCQHIIAYNIDTKTPQIWTIFRGVICFVTENPSGVTFRHRNLLWNFSLYQVIYFPITLTSLILKWNPMPRVGEECKTILYLKYKRWGGGGHIFCLEKKTGGGACLVLMKNQYPTAPPPINNEQSLSFYKVLLINYSIWPSRE